MLDIWIIREQPDLVRRSIEQRNLNPEHADLDRLLQLDGEWRKVQGRVDELRGQRNAISATIKKLAAEERERAVAEVRALKQELGELEQRLEVVREERDGLLRRMPNLLAEDVRAAAATRTMRRSLAGARPRTSTSSRATTSSSGGSPIPSISIARRR